MTKPMPKSFWKLKETVQTTPCTREIIIYEIIGEKVGSTSDLSDRLSRQGRKVDDDKCRVIFKIPANTQSLWEVWQAENVTANVLGYTRERTGSFAIFLKAHETGTDFRYKTIYSLTDDQGSPYMTILDAAQLEKDYKLRRGTISKAANRNTTNSVLELDGDRYTVTYYQA
tara:strand:+ start:578 stop:1090 length:513 start_codon:yes stop_codon:yes gene_type:complete